MAARRRKSEEAPTMDCIYGCGNAAEGTLNLSFMSYRDDSPTPSYRNEFSCYLPACKRCVRQAVMVRIAIPEEGSRLREAGSGKDERR